jgi:RNA-binding protein Nova
MAVSRKLCGAVIGQKGQTIRDFMLDSGATIRVQVCGAVWC